jgi:hypothetical protein
MPRKKQVNSQHSKKPTKAKKNGLLAKDVSSRHLYEEYYDLKEMKTKPINRDWIERFFQAEYLWAVNDENALVLSLFLSKMGVSPRTFRNWVKKYPQEAERHYDALSVIGARREVGALKKSYSETIVKYTAPHYDEDWKEIAKFQAALTQAENAAKGDRIIDISQIEHKAVPENDHLFENKKLTCSVS